MKPTPQLFTSYEEGPLFGQRPPLGFDEALDGKTPGLASRGLAWRVTFWAVLALFLAALAFGLTVLLAPPAGAQDPDDLLEGLCELCGDAALYCEAEPPDGGDLLATWPAFTSTVGEPSVDLWFPLAETTTYEELEVSFTVELSPEVFAPPGPGVRLYSLDWQSTKLVRPWNETVAYLQFKEKNGNWSLQLGSMRGVPRRGEQLKKSAELGRAVPEGAYHVLLGVEQQRVSVLVVGPDGEERRVTVETPDGPPLAHHGVFARFGHTGNEAGNETPFRPGATWRDFEVRGFPTDGVAP